jgi:hypothetical protein
LSYLVFRFEVAWPGMTTWSRTSVGTETSFANPLPNLQNGLCRGKSSHDTGLALQTPRTVSGTVTGTSVRGAEVAASWS